VITTPIYLQRAVRNCVHLLPYLLSRMSFMPAVSSNYYFLVSVPIFCFGRSMDCETILYQSNLPHEKSNSRGNHYFFRCQWCSSPKERTASYPGPSVGLTFLFVFFFYSSLRSYGVGKEWNQYDKEIYRGRIRFFRFRREKFFMR